MKNYLIDELTFKKFVQKVKSSADGDQVTAVIKQQQNDRFVEKGWLCLTFCFREKTEIRKSSERDGQKKRKPKAEKSVKSQAAKKRKTTAKPKAKEPESDNEPADYDQEQTRANEPEESQEFSKQSPVQSNSDLSDWDNGFWN